ncbi:MAG: hypothetical protein H6722_30210 [Sandaracinus sp.]|nr:hypothetical protein [Sandaracinus sp.]
MVAPRSPALEGRTVVASAPSESSTTLHVLAFVTASVLGHVAFAAVMPEDFQLPPIEEPPRELAVFFEVDEPEPEPPPEVVPEPEEEPLELPDEAPEPPPVVRRVVEEPEPQPETPPRRPRKRPTRSRPAATRSERRRDLRDR